MSDASTNNTGFSAAISCVASPIKVDNTTYTQSQLISSVFMGDCLTATNIQFHGMNDMMGYFTNGTSIGIQSGVVLTSGSIFNVPGPNNQANATIDHAQAGDAQLTAAVGVNTQDASSIEFDFVPKNDSVTFDFVFGSEEYPEWICQGYNDAFGFFVTGPGYAANTNVALIPGTTTPIAIDNINTTGTCATIYPQYYVNNTGGTACQYDGYTTPMRALIHCTQCESYHIKIVVADVGDGLYDSGVFLKAQSFSAGHNLVVSATGNNGSNGIYEGCDGYFTFTNLDGADTIPTTVSYQILGNANNGNDYQAITNYVVIPAGQTSVTLPIYTLWDANVEANEFVRVKLLSYCNCNNIPQATLWILDNSSFNAIISPSQTICQGQSSPITVSASGNQNLPYHYLWSTGATTSSITVSPNTTATYRVTVTNPCDNATDTASTTITVIPALSVTPTKTNVSCNGNNNGSISLAVTGGQTPYSYLWSNGATTANISGLTPNTYSVTVTAGVCSTTSTYTITQPTSLGLSLSSVNPACNGVSSGSVSSTVTGGTSPFNYLWNNSATTANRSSLAAGTYSLTVTDANGCTNTASVTITNTTSISVSTSSSNAICFGGNSGTASSTVSGGTSPFTYHWSNNATTSNI
ncbi:MAG: choice-of-anchor L domain-containing protein, partial [Bacteroidota bacterium]